MARATDMLRGAALGGALGGVLMYYLDPEHGRRRRAKVGDRLVHLRTELDGAVDVGGRDLRNRIRGAVAEARSRFRAEEVSDDVLEARVRSALGRVCSHPGSVTVASRSGRVELHGPILADEVDAVLDAVRSVRGVREVVNGLTVYEKVDAVPGLQGGDRPRTGGPLGLRRESWPPATRWIVGSGGALIAVAGLRRGGLVGGLLASAGTLALARSVTNMNVSRLTGLGTERRGIDVRKAINIDAPVEEVWALWDRYEEFPAFMEHVREVRKVDEEHSHWVVKGPLGADVSWDAVVTSHEPERRIAWKSVAGSTVGHAGVVRFDPTPDGGTRIDVQMTYAPPAGLLGHAVASLFGVDPKSAMDEDLVRFKSLLEDGRTTADGKTTEREEVAS